MNRRGFLQRVGVAFCGAVLYTFPDFAPAHPEVRHVFTERYLRDVIRANFDETFRMKLDEIESDFYGTIETFQDMDMDPETLVQVFGLRDPPSIRIDYGGA